MLVRGDRDSSPQTISAACLVGSDQWSGDRETLAVLLRKARVTHRLPFRARVVAWGLPETNTRIDVEQLPTFGLLAAAGFEIEEAVSPARALARTVASRGIDTRSKAVAAVSLNAHGGAIAIVYRGELISSRVFDWPLGAPFSGSRSELLDRYLVIAQLAPQLQHLIELARPVHGTQVGSILLCGNLRDLRSISMLLIDELDIEVETLDSTDLLGPECLELAGSVAALQLASAVAVSSPKPLVRPAPVERPARSHLALSRYASALGALALVATWSILQFLAASPAIPLSASPQPGELASAERTPVVPPLRTEATMGRVEAVGVPVAPPEVLAPPAAVPATVAPARPSVPAPRLAEAPSSEPLPRVDGIMISGDRSLAIVEGNVVAPGDKVGSRALIRIDRDGVVLRDPSGGEVHVAIRTRKATPTGTDIRPQP